MKVRLPHLPQLTSQLAGFTMIELLIVITILGILAVAVLSAINPIEQINRGRDTGKRSDAEQLLSAIDRYNAFNGFQPWMKDANVLTADRDIMNASGQPVIVADTLRSTPADAGETCSILERLGSTTPVVNPSYCRAGNELKQAYIDRIISGGAERPLYIYNQGRNGDSTYICFSPQSQAFQSEAAIRCGDTTGTDMPNDLTAAARAFICNGTTNTTGSPLTCLP